MSRICCPICGSDKVEIVDQKNPTKTTTQRKTFPKPPMQNLLHYVVNYAAMGASGARMIRGQRPIVFVIGALVGGAIGCAACLLNHVHEQTPDPILKESPLPQTLYHCLECEHHFALPFEHSGRGF
ncbi:hypothetical protein ABUS21_11505 [Acinetobacter baumannii]|uniref:hypothetical protein n=1 Tax=Acinetobacter baumannii TaxID=470 RepID=UPI003D03C688